jgi:pilus assembly protein CpaF
MVMMAGYDLPMKAIRQQVASALDLIVHLERLNDGSRKVVALTEVQGMESDVITLQELFSFEIEGVTSSRAVIGALQPTGLRPTFTAKFEKHGETLPTELFGGASAPPLALDDGRSHAFDGMPRA